MRTVLSGSGHLLKHLDGEVFLLGNLDGASVHQQAPASLAIPFDRREREPAYIAEQAVRRDALQRLDQVGRQSGLRRRGSGRRTGRRQRDRDEGTWAVHYFDVLPYSASLGKSVRKLRRPGRGHAPARNK
jgi:hypothetical protein